MFRIEGTRIMDWDQLARVAQLVTEAPTLVVAVFVAVQLRIQRKDSECSQRIRADLWMSVAGEVH